jgi:hypothetical protein
MKHKGIMTDKKHDMCKNLINMKHKNLENYRNYWMIFLKWMEIMKHKHIETWTSL